MEILGILEAMKEDLHFPDFSLSNFYCIAGQALDFPEYFGFTDPLTGTWKPKKYENTTIGASPTLSNGALIIRAKRCVH